MARTAAASTRPVAISADYISTRGVSPSSSESKISRRLRNTVLPSNCPSCCLSAGSSGPHLSQEVQGADDMTTEVGDLLFGGMGKKPEDYAQSSQFQDRDQIKSLISQGLAGVNSRSTPQAT